MCAWFQWDPLQQNPVKSHFTCVTQEEEALGTRPTDVFRLFTGMTVSGRKQPKSGSRACDKTWLSIGALAPRSDASSASVPELGLSGTKAEMEEPHPLWVTTASSSDAWRRGCWGPQTSGCTVPWGSTLVQLPSAFLQPSPGQGPTQSAGHRDTPCWGNGACCRARDRAWAGDRGTPDLTRGTWDPDGAVLARPWDPTAVPTGLEHSVSSHHVTPIHSHQQLTERSPVLAANCGKGDSRFIPKACPFPSEISFSTPVGRQVNTRGKH